ncbi:MAG TPA: hypothetical protein VJ890_09540 [Vineibacter sp.]|nr:hypothetical protein [Vineibacter sp.]
MPSKLVGLFKTLAWTDFTGTPPAGSTHLAFTSADFTLPAVTGVKDATTGEFVMNDNITITINFNASKSWKKMDAINAKKLRTPAQILKHEQGHYDIVALIARDLFIDLMQLKANVYKDQAALNVDVAPILKKYNGTAQKIINKYDTAAESDHGENGTGQTKWDGFIKSAFTTPRTPAQSAPDGTTYKTPLLDVLKAAGITV